MSEILCFAPSGWVSESAEAMEKRQKIMVSITIFLSYNGTRRTEVGMVRCYLSAATISAVLWAGLVLALQSVASTCLQYFSSLGGLVSLARLWP